MTVRYKSLVAFAAALAFAPALSAQTNTFFSHEKYEESNGIGTNKYLLSDLPNEDGEYTIRLETFVTGDVKKVSVPTDFVLALDVSGSMLYNYLMQGEDPETVYPLNSPKIQQDDGFSGYTSYTCLYPVRESDGYIQKSLGSWFELEPSANATNPTATAPAKYATRYIRYKNTSNPSNDGYYRIWRKTVQHPTTGKYYRNLVYRLKDGNLRYLWGNEAYRTTPVYDDALLYDSHVSPDPSVNAVIYTGTTYRLKQRREALIEGVSAFIQQIADENDDESHWATGVTRHQVAIVQFGYNYPSYTPSINENTYSDSNTKVGKAFGAVTNSNKSQFVAAVTRATYAGSTFLDLGVHLSRMLLEDLQTKPNMAPLNSSGGVNRNKVVVVFTDGEISPDSGTGGTTGVTASYFGRISAALNDAVAIKAVRSSASGSQINAKIFTIDMANIDHSAVFLQRLSSNYPNATATKTSGGYSTDLESDYTGSPITPASDRIYYQDAGHTHLTDIFTAIADATTGENTSSSMVAVDVMSNSFSIPANVSGKVKFYTMNCWGKKTIDGTEYLVFGNPVLAPNRASLANIWVSFTDENDNTQWKNVGTAGDGTYADIDARISYEISSDRKTITIKGFNYAYMWCGHDADHENSHHGVGSGQTNYDAYLASMDPDGKNRYRGFKLIAEFPVKADADAVGGPEVPTNDAIHSGVYKAGDDGNPTGGPIVNYPTPDVPLPVHLTIQKTGLKPGESASFTVQRRLASNASSTYQDYTTFILTGDASNTPEVKLLNLDPSYYYKVKETGWSWSYTLDTDEPSTEDPNLENPIVFENTPSTTTVKHAEAKATNVLKNN